MTVSQLKITRILLLIFTFLISFSVLNAQVDQVKIINDEKGAKLVVNGKDFIVNGMNWDYSQSVQIIHIVFDKT